jgi:hypothetical protein
MSSAFFLKNTNWPLEHFPFFCRYSTFPFFMDLSIKYNVHLYKYFIASIFLHMVFSWNTLLQQIGFLVPKSLVFSSFLKSWYILQITFDGRDVWRALLTSGSVIGALRGGDSNRFNLWEIIYRRTWHEMCQTHLCSGNIR